MFHQHTCKHIQLHQQAHAQRENDAICYTNSKKKIIIITLGNSMKKKGSMQQEK